MRFFFYGTLMDEDVRSAVLGRAAPRSVEAVTLEGWRRVPIPGKSYPAIVPDPRATVEGVLARGLNAAARGRLVRYEDDLYDLVEVEVRRTGGRHLAAFAFVAREGRLSRSRREWDLAAWQRRCKRRFLTRLARTAAPS
jgi:Gamma-glutamyl cyclotransferase, AIG2-like